MRKRHFAEAENSLSKQDCPIFFYLFCFSEEAKAYFTKTTTIYGFFPVFWVQFDIKSLLFGFESFILIKIEVKFHEKFGYREKVCHPCEKTKNSFGVIFYLFLLKLFEKYSSCFSWLFWEKNIFLYFFGRKTFFFTFLGEKYFSLLFWEKNHFSLLFWEKNNQTIIQSRSSGLHFARRQSA